MLTALGELLPLAFGVAISPLPIIALVVILMTPNAIARASGFLLGWVLAIGTVLFAVTLVAGTGALTGTGISSIVAIVKIILGAALFLLAVHEWRIRPRRGEQAQLPHWLRAVEEMKALAAVGLGFVIYLSNPKNLALGAAAGIALGNSALPQGDAIVAGAIYLLVASTTVIVPTVAYVLERERMHPYLDELKVWMTEHNAAIMASVLGLMGAVMVGKGIATL